MKPAHLSQWKWLAEFKSITFGLAVFNFALVWTLDAQMRGIAPLVDPWYHPWSYFNEPSRLLLACSLLLLDRIWSYLAAITVSGYIFVRFVYLFAVWNGTWFQEWTYLRKFEPYFAGSYESQGLLALIVLAVGLYCLARVALRERAEMAGG